jgi:MYXO-CTERM domain-containing protein
VLYPGFNAAYPNNAPGWSVGYDLNGDTFTALWNLSKGVGQVVQIATWNDYTEGTMIEPTNEFGYKYLTTLQKLLGVSYGQGELEIVRQLYDRRKANDPKAEAASQALIKLDVAGACAQLGCTAPVHGNGSGGSSNGSAGSTSGAAGSQTMTGGGGSGTGNGAGTGSSVAGSSSGGSAPSGGGGAPGAGASVGGDTPEDTAGTKRRQKDNSGCSLQVAGSPSNAAYFAAALALTALVRRRRRAA